MNLDRYTVGHNQYSNKMENPPIDRILKYLKKTIGYHRTMKATDKNRTYLYELFNKRRDEDEIREIYETVIEKLNRVGIIEKE